MNFDDDQDPLVIHVIHSCKKCGHTGELPAPTETELKMRNKLMGPDIDVKLRLPTVVTNWLEEWAKDQTDREMSAEGATMEFIISAYVKERRDFIGIDLEALHTDETILRARAAAWLPPEPASAPRRDANHAGEATVIINRLPGPASSVKRARRTRDQNHNRGRSCGSKDTGPLSDGHSK